MIERVGEYLNKKNVALGYSYLRSGVFYLESLPIFTLHWLTAKNGVETLKKHREVSLKYLNELLEKDAENIAKGIYPASVLTPERPWPHLKRLLSIFQDTLGVTMRRRLKNIRRFNKKAREWVDELPPYYRRNFHFQTDGYLSEGSAALYDHQTEILFRGAGGAMRRMAIPPIKSYLEGEDGRGSRFLEVAAGAGTSTRFVAQAFPRAKITCVDLSYPYLKMAQKNLKDLGRLDFVQSDASSMPFKDRSFDVVYSVFLFHELPEDVRREVVYESLRVLKKGGLFVMVDSLQKGDCPELDWAIEQFPKDFHEPYYKNYTQKPMEKILQLAGLTDIHCEYGFLSKVLWARKSL